MGAVRKATNLYRRVSAVNYRTGVKNTSKHLKPTSSKCLVCLVTLVKSSNDRQRAGVRLRCQCNVRVCTTCFQNPEWHLTTPHFTTCPTLRGFICAVCACFEGCKEKVCCVWMCTRCSADHQTQGARCPQCARSVDRSLRRETRTLWTNGPSLETEDVDKVAVDDEKIADYRDLIKSRVFTKVSRSRHLTASDIRPLFHECFAPQVCTCVSEGNRNPMCPSCTPVLTLLQLLAKNPRPLIASLAERAVPGRALVRNVYDRALLISMLNDQDLPLCANGRSCKGMLVNVQNNPKPLPSLISPESYNHFVMSRVKNASEVQQINPCCCILCLLFNQSAAVVQMLSSDSLHFEPHPSEPVYYFNVKLSPDVGASEVWIEYHGYLVNFQGSVGSYKPTFYYNWRDMLTLLHRDSDGKVTFSPQQ